MRLRRTAFSLSGFLADQDPAPRQSSHSHLFLVHSKKFKGRQAEQAAEKIGHFVIPSAARDLLFHQRQEKNGFLGQTPPSE
jgi:hypothetical protein